MKIYLFTLLSILPLYCNAQDETPYLTNSEIKNDLAFLDHILQNKSSYQGLNGYDYTQDVDQFLKTSDTSKITQFDFGLFLSKTIGKIGDRHSYIKDYELRDSLYLPIAFAPFEGKILVVDYHHDRKEYAFWNSKFPYLKAINSIPIETLLPQILPSELLAPKETYFTSAVRELRDIETIFRLLDMDLPNPLSITLSDEKEIELEVNIDLVGQLERARLWDDRFYKNTFRVSDEQYNDIAFIDQFFTFENNVGYIQIADMLERENNSVFFDFLNNFMTEAKQSDALIIDVRDNEGGTRDLIQELAGYFIHPDSIYVVNLAKQRGGLPLNRKLKKSLHSRYLFSKDELDIREQHAVDQFMTSFKPMYHLSSEHFSEYHYYILNGQKITQNKFHFKKPIYILANERSFSAASILVSVFKGLPNIKIAGVSTDGSSGNSQRFELHNSNLRGKISTMVSYQKDGQILDGIGTKPDILIKRSLNQIFLKEDYQLMKLLDTIKER